MITPTKINTDSYSRAVYTVVVVRSLCHTRFHYYCFVWLITSTPFNASLSHAPHNPTKRVYIYDAHRHVDIKAGWKAGGGGRSSALVKLQLILLRAREKNAESTIQRVEKKEIKCITHRTMSRLEIPDLCSKPR